MPSEVMTVPVAMSGKAAVMGACPFFREKGPDRDGAADP